MKNRFRVGMITVIIASLMLAGCSSRVSETPSSSPAEVSSPAGEAEEDMTSSLPEEKEEAETEPAQETAEEASDNPESVQETNASEEEDIEKAIEAYAAFIEGKKGNAESSFLSYTLIHLDDDGMPELAVSYGDSHPDGVTFYHYDGANVNEVLFAGSLGRAYYEKGNGIVFGWYTGMGETYYTIAAVKDGKVTDITRPAIAIQYNENFEETGYKYYESGEDFDDREITEEKFNEMLSPYSPDKRDYRELEYGKMNDAYKAADTIQTLKASLEEEDNLPKPDMEQYIEGVITGN